MSGAVPDKQIGRTRKVLMAPKTGRASQATQADVLAAARQRVAARGG